MPQTPRWEVVNLDELGARRYFPSDVSIRVDYKSRTVDIFGGDSRRTESDPYWIEFGRIGSVEDVTDWMLHLAEKTWFPESQLRELRDALLVVFRGRRRRKPQR